MLKARAREGPGAQWGPGLETGSEEPPRLGPGSVPGGNIPSSAGRHSTRSTTGGCHCPGSYNHGGGAVKARGAPEGPGAEGDALPALPAPPIAPAEGMVA